MQALKLASPRTIFNAVATQASPPEGGSYSELQKYIAQRAAGTRMQMCPEFPPAARWLNAPQLRLRQHLKGKVVVLDFWTYCCINCLHVLPKLAELEAEFEGQAVQVVGVHSAKFDNETSHAALRSAVLRCAKPPIAEKASLSSSCSPRGGSICVVKHTPAHACTTDAPSECMRLVKARKQQRKCRYKVQHPVINDADKVLWKALGISSWPTLAVVSPTGEILASFQGEQSARAVQRFVHAALDYYQHCTELNHAPVPLVCHPYLCVMTSSQ